MTRTFSAVFFDPGQVCLGSVRAFRFHADTLVWAHYHGGSFLVAAPLFGEAAKKEPANPTYHYHLGLTYQKLKEPTRARAELQKAISIAPKSPIADLARQADDYARLAGH